MNNLVDNSITIYDALQNIKNGKYVMPAFQRQFVWSMEQIEKLWDSLLLDYPIATFLYWRVDESNVSWDTYFCYFLTDVTFDSRKEADSVKEDKDVIYAPISYSGHILNWLEKCQISLENNQSNQTLKKILTQYIVLIRKLTNQPRSKEMGEDYIKTIFEGNNLTSYLIMV